MNTIVFLATLAIFAMVNAASLQDGQKKDLQSLLNALTDQKTEKNLTPNEQQVL